MQLTCPNCDARYEVDASMIPAEGRDVQCSNCTTTWFQPGIDQNDSSPDAGAPPPEPPVAHREATRPLQEDDEPDPRYEPEPHPEPEPEPEPPVDEYAYAAHDDEPEQDDVPAYEPPPPDERPRRELAPEVRDVLRQEAEREAALRAQDAGGFEVQDEMPLAEQPEVDARGDTAAAHDDLGSRVSDLVSDAEQIGELDDAPRERAMRPIGGSGATEDDLVEAQIAAAAAGATSGSRRDLLPDIEEINSTLRATNERGGRGEGASDYETVETRPRRRAGTRLGFGLAVLIFAALVGVYSQAPRIAASVPQMAPILEQYVGQVDRLRGWINDVAQGALTDESATAGAGATAAPQQPQDSTGVTDVEETAAQAPGLETPAAPEEVTADN